MNNVDQLSQAQRDVMLLCSCAAIISVAESVRVPDLGLPEMTVKASFEVIDKLGGFPAVFEAAGRLAKMVGIDPDTLMAPR